MRVCLAVRGTNECYRAKGRDVLESFMAIYEPGLKRNRFSILGSQNERLDLDVDNSNGERHSVA